MNIRGSFIVVLILPWLALLIFLTFLMSRGFGTRVPKIVEVSPVDERLFLANLVESVA